MNTAIAVVVGFAVGNVNIVHTHPIHRIQYFCRTIFCLRVYPAFYYKFISITAGIKFYSRSAEAIYFYVFNDESVKFVVGSIARSIGEPSGIGR